MPLTEVSTFVPCRPEVRAGLVPGPEGDRVRAAVHGVGQETQLVDRTQQQRGGTRNGAHVDPRAPGIESSIATCHWWR